MAFDLTGQYISESFKRLFTNDTYITDATGSIISSLNFNAPFTSSGIQAQNFQTSTNVINYDSTASMVITDAKTVEMFDHSASYNAPAGALFVSGGSLYFAATEHTGDLEKEYQNSGYGKFKNDLAEAMVAFLQPIQERFHKLRQDKTEMDRILKQGAEMARERAQSILNKIHHAIGFI